MTLDAASSLARTVSCFRLPRNDNKPPIPSVFANKCLPRRPDNTDSSKMDARKMRPTRYAHFEGHTDLCYTSDGRFVDFFEKCERLGFSFFLFWSYFLDLFFGFLGYFASGGVPRSRWGDLAVYLLLVEENKSKEEPEATRRSETQRKPEKKTYLIKKMLKFE